MSGTVYEVHYASAGCLPDTDEPTTFDTLEDAAQYVRDEYMEIVDQFGIADTAVLMDHDYIAKNMGADDPRPNSLYRWSIEEHGWA